MTGPETLLYSIGATIVVLGAWLMKAEAKAPPTEAPAPTDTHDKDIKAELADLRRAIDKMHDAGTRRGEDSEDAFRDVGQRLDRIERGVERICDRMDTETRIGVALARLHRPDGG